MLKPHILWVLFITAFLISPIVDTMSDDGEASKVNRCLKNILSSTVKLAAQETVSVLRLPKMLLYDDPKKFIQAVREEGKMRILLKKREPLPKITWIIDPVFAALHVPATVMKTTREPTQWITVPISTYAYIKLIDSLKNNADKKMEKLNTDKMVGVSYIDQLISIGLILPDSRISTIYKHDKLITGWSQDSSMKRELPRLAEFLKLKIIPDHQMAGYINQLAWKVYKQALDESQKSNVALEEVLYSLWSKTVDEDVKLSLLSEEVRGMIYTAYLPVVPVEQGFLESVKTTLKRNEEQTDVSLSASALGFNPEKFSTAKDLTVSLKNEWKEIGLVNVLSVVTRTQKDPNVVKEKRRVWLEAIKPQVSAESMDMLSFLKRADFSSSPDSEEIKLWIEIWSNPLMLDIKEAYLAGNLSDLDTISFAIEVMKNYESLREVLHKYPTPSTENLCRMRGHPLFSGANTLVSQLETTASLSLERKESCTLYAMENLWQYYKDEEVAADDPKTFSEFRSKRLAKIQEQTQKCLNENVKLRSCLSDQ